MSLSVLDISFDSEDSFVQSEKWDTNVATQDDLLNISFSSDGSVEFIEEISKINNEYAKCRGDLTYNRYDICHNIESHYFSFISISESQLVNEQVYRIVNHQLKFNGSYRSLEHMSTVVNETPNAAIQTPCTTYKIKQLMVPVFKSETHINCHKCHIYSACSGSETECDSCKVTIKTSHSEYFTYIPIKQQLERSIKCNANDILEYNSKVLNNNGITDIQNSFAFGCVKKKYSSHILLPLIVNTDGVKVFKYSSYSLWLIQLYQGYLPPNKRYKPENVIIVSVYFGMKKPCMRDFFYPFLRDLREINDENGLVLVHNEKRIQFMPFLFSCCSDLPATTTLLEMNGHSGTYACSKCFHPGKLVKSKTNNSSTIRYVKGDYGIRTHESIVDIYSQLKGNKMSIKGIKGVSCLISAKDFDLSNDISIDHMHCVELGVMKKLLHLWLDTKNHKEPFYIKKKNQILLSTRIVEIKPNNEFIRKPKSISHFGEYKANEFRALMLYFLRFALPGVLDSKYIKHFHLLCTAMYLLLSENISHDSINEAENRLQKFADEFEVLYGENNVTMNLHLIRHLSSTVRQLGPLWSQSAYAFENNNGIVVRGNTCKNNIVHQLTWKYIMKQTINTPSVENNKFAVGKIRTIKLSSSDAQLYVCNGFRLEREQYLKVHNDIILRGSKFTSKMSREISTIDYFVQLKSGTVGSVCYYFSFDSILYACIDVYEIVEKFDHFIQIMPGKQKKLLKIIDFDSKLLYLKYGLREFVTRLANKYEKC